MDKEQFYTTSQAAKVLGISRMQITRKIHKGEIKAIRIGRSFIIPENEISPIFKSSTKKDLKKTDEGVEKVFKEYGEVLRKLGNE